MDQPNVTPHPQGVPQEMLDRLHQANERFHAQKQALDANIEGVEYRHQERIDQSNQLLREAETEVERVQEDIRKFLDERAVHASRADK